MSSRFAVVETALSFAGLLSGLTGPAAAGVASPGPASAHVVKDIHPLGSQPRRLTVAGNRLFFSARDRRHGRELWRSDGTPAGTRLVKDINPGRRGSRISHMKDVGDIVLFRVHDGRHGDELWRSDGTAEGTRLVKRPGSPRIDIPGGLKRAGGTVFFSADDGRHGEELWRSDGTAAGTRLVKDISRAPRGKPAWAYSSRPIGLEAVGETVFFNAFDRRRGRELWRSDGTRRGTRLVKDIDPRGNGDPRELTNVGGTVFFLASEHAPDGHALWRSDGTARGTRVVKDPDSGEPYELTNVAGTLFFIVQHFATDVGDRRELWRSDGTAAGTTLVKAINPGGARNGEGPRNLTDVGGTLFFSASDAAQSGGQALWRSDGTESGTTLVKDTNPGVVDIGPRGVTYPRELTSVGGMLFFAGLDGGGARLWRSDGTDSGTVPVAGNALEPRSLTPVGSTLLFTARQGREGRELWRIAPPFPTYRP